jgi:hypothetical protein
MDININLLEVASELAHQVVCAKFEDDDISIYQSTTDTVTSYTEEAQDLFNEWYDYYYDLLFNFKNN